MALCKFGECQAVQASIPAQDAKSILGGGGGDLGGGVFNKITWRDICNKYNVVWHTTIMVKKKKNPAQEAPVPARLWDHHPRTRTPLGRGPGTGRDWRLEWDCIVRWGGRGGDIRSGQGTSGLGTCACPRSPTREVPAWKPFYPRSPRLLIHAVGDHRPRSCRACGRARTAGAGCGGPGPGLVRRA